MADYTTIPDAAVDPDAPLTSQLGYAWRDNPIAIAEGAAGAPKIAVPVDGGDGSTIIFSGMGDFYGACIDFYHVGGVGGTSVEVSFSDNGSSYYGITAVASATSGNLAIGKTWIDFRSASVKSAGIEASPGISAFYSSSTASGLTAAVTHIKLEIIGSGGTLSAVITPNGGIL